MKKLILLYSLFFLSLAHAAPPAGYYDSAIGKTGDDLRTALHAIVQNGSVVVPYSSTGFDTSDALKIIDSDPANSLNVLVIYSGFSEPKADFGLTTGWDREHLWPNSYGIDSTGPAYSDLHNLRPIDFNVNSSRGNKWYDYSNPADGNYRNPANAEAPECSSDTNSWEPPDRMKGDIARALMYMDVRYSGVLVLTPDLSTINSSAARMGNLFALLRWSDADPVDSAEQNRNDSVFNLQQNRNPFVDHPEWVHSIFDPRLSVAQSASSVVVSWSATFSNAALQQNSGGVWSDITSVPVASGGRLFVTQPITAGFRLYRLRF